jgi:GR25 family glycosyltransferase involved in LPS biosynthesis
MIEQMDISDAQRQQAMRFKLKNFAPVFWINLDADSQRRTYMERWLIWLELDAQRVSGYDGRIHDLRQYLAGHSPAALSQPEVGCVLSHLRAIRHFVEETEAEYAIILEDDVDFVSVEFWTFNWKFFLSFVPYDWDVLQLAIINHKGVIPKLHPRQPTDFSTAAYAITRLYAQKLLQLHVQGERYKIDNGVKPRPVADELIYNAGKTYSIPLLLYRTELGSHIQQHRVQTLYKPCRDALYHFWTHQAVNLSPSYFF